jgi:AcrR family transcriptional regulator
MALDRDETSERVLEIAEALIAKGGAPNLKARSIAQQAGIAVGSIYNLFGDLDQLHGQVNMRLLDRLGAAGEQAVTKLDKAKVTDTRQRLLALARTYLEFVQANAVGWAALLAFNPRRMAVDAQNIYEQRLDTLFEIIAAVLGQDDTLAIDEAKRRLMARVLWSSVHGIVINGAGRRQQSRQGEGAWDQIDLLVTTFLKGIDHR